MMNFSDIKVDNYLHNVKRKVISTHHHNNTISQVFWCRASDYRGFFLMNVCGSIYTAVFLDEFAEASLLLGNTEDFFELYRSGIVDYGERCKINYIYNSITSIREEPTRWRIGAPASDYDNVYRYFYSQTHASECLNRIAA